MVLTICKIGDKTCQSSTNIYTLLQLRFLFYCDYKMLPSLQVQVKKIVEWFFARFTNKNEALKLTVCRIVKYWCCVLLIS